MTYKIVYWDSVESCQKERDATPSEAAEIDARKGFVAIPDSVPMLNARLALIQAGLIDTAQAFFDNMEGENGKEARAYWDHAQNVRRDNQWVEQARVALGLTNKQIDDLFIAASTIA